MRLTSLFFIVLCNILNVRPVSPQGARKEEKSDILVRGLRSFLTLMEQNYDADLSCDFLVSVARKNKNT